MGSKYYSQKEHMRLMHAYAESAGKMMGWCMCTGVVIGAGLVGLVWWGVS